MSNEIYTHIVIIIDKVYSKVYNVLYGLFTVNAVDMS